MERLAPGGLRSTLLVALVDKIEYILLGDYPLKWSDEHMRMRLCDYFSLK